MPLLYTPLILDLTPVMVAGRLITPVPFTQDRSDIKVSSLATKP